MIEITWAKVMADVANLCEYWDEDDFTTVAGIANGGIVPAVLVANRLKIKNIITIHKDQTRDQVESMLQDYEAVLIIDDINDTGDTIGPYLNMDHKNCRVATIYQRYCTMYPDPLYGYAIPHNEWLKFPWEANDW